MLKRIGITLLLLIVLCTIGGAVYYRHGLQPVAEEGEKDLVYLPQGRGIWALATILKKEGIIRSAPVFYIAYRWHILTTGEGKQIAGEYFDLSPADSVSTIIQSGLQEPAVRWITFPEGHTIEQMADRIAATDLLISKQAFLRNATAQAVREATDFPFDADSAEGYLFPDTYQFPIGVEADEVVTTLCQTFEEKFYQPNAQQIAQSDLSLHEIVTIAAMIEREARVDKDRPLISSVIRNRLQRDMRLQIDATVQYALGTHKDRLMHSDLQVKSPYNTYLHRGLPPGPICNPGLASLQAAIHPADTGYLYYVARPDGSHVFTTTYARHQQAIRQIRQ
ncbi:MAG: endolytic transglycosylase MltG [Armatimonadota bacterium]